MVSPHAAKISIGQYEGSPDLWSCIPDQSAVSWQKFTLRFAFAGRNSSMSSDEAIDRVTATGVFVETLSRSEVHRLGHWHQVFHCLIVRPTRSTVVLQRRSASARSFAGRLDLSATGHLVAGEDPTAGIRELREELGIHVDHDQLVPLGTRLLADDSGEGQNRERIHVFLLSDERPLTDFEPDPSEVQSLVEVPIDELLLVLDDPAAEAKATEWQPGSKPRDTILSAQELVGQVDSYWLVLLVMAQRFVDGNRPLAI